MSSDLPSNDRSKPASTSRLTNAQAESVVATVAQLGASELPLAGGLRAAADETSTGRVAQALRGLADSIESGVSLETVLEERDRVMPAHLRGLIAASARTGRMAIALDELVDHYRVTRETWWTVISALSYPVIVLALGAVVCLMLPLYLVPQFAKMFDEFALQLPAITQLLLSFSEAVQWIFAGPGAWGLLVIGVVIAGFAILASLGVGTGWSQRFAATIPLIGPLWQWTGAAAFSRLLATLLDHDVPLPEAVRLAGDGTRDPNVREAARVLATGIEDGHSLSDLLAKSYRMPPTMAPFVRWGEQTGELPAAFQTLSELFVSRIHLRITFLRSVSPPVIFIVVALLVMFTCVGLFLPLIVLIDGLT